MYVDIKGHFTDSGEMKVVAGEDESNLTEIIAKWSEILADDFLFVKTLAAQMIIENKTEALRNVF